MAVVVASTSSYSGFSLALPLLGRSALGARNVEMEKSGSVNNQGEGGPSTRPRVSCAVEWVKMMHAG